VKDLKQYIRPLPYYSTTVTDDERWLAEELRREFVPKINHAKSTISHYAGSEFCVALRKHFNYI
jgi:hypothetical protein